MQAFDINNDGYVNEEDLIDMLLLILEKMKIIISGDLNFDTQLNIFDIIILCDSL